MLEIKPDLKEVMPFINNAVLTDIEKRMEQIIFFFGTDAPFGILPAGGAKEIKEAIEKININEDELL